MNCKKPSNLLGIHEDSNIDRTLKAQALCDSSHAGHMAWKKTMEINSTNIIINALHDKADTDVWDLIWLLYDTYVLTSGDYLLMVPGDWWMSKQYGWGWWLYLCLMVIDADIFIVNSSID